MNVLHLLSNWKRTGPAGLAANLAAGLARHDVTVWFGCNRSPRDQANVLQDYARYIGLERVAAFHMAKHFRLIDGFRGFHELRRFIRDHHIELVHTHTHNDHFLGGLAARCQRHRPLVVRSDYDGFLVKPSVRTRFALRYLTDHLIVGSVLALQSRHLAACVPRSRVSLIRPGVDTVRFDPNRPLADESAVKIPPGSVVAGIVARVQPHRNFHLLLNAFAEAARQEPRLHLVIVGRGSHIDRIGKQPVRDMGLGDRVTFTGYLQGDQYVATLNSFDFQLFLVPGSDGTCRASREGMAMAKPMIVSRRGILPELVAHGQCGLVIDESEPALTEALLKLTRDILLRENMGRSARQRMLDLYDAKSWVAATLTLYRQLLGST